MPIRRWCGAGTRGAANWLATHLLLLLSAGFSIVSLLLFGRRMLERFGRGPAHVVDSLVDEEAVALSAMEPDAPGKVELRGSAWNARHAGEAQIAAGDRCRVARVEGLVVFVRRSS